MGSMTGLSQTIAAVATAPGSAGVGIVRVSGTEALRIADQIFVGKRKPSCIRGGRFLYGHLMDGEEMLDEGLCLVFRQPQSYTGEDVVEFQTHGSPAVLARVLARVLALGARVARPGEFSLRAYEAGRLDLTQAEAVLELTRASTEAARRQSMLGLSGALGQKIESISAKITREWAGIAALLDYPEEGVPPQERTGLAEAAEELRGLLGSARAGRWATGGVRLALLGKPNAGKSSLLNALVGYERSIVTPVAGTTRDYVEVGLELAGFPITLIDTAGIRETEDAIEAAGVAWAKELARGADVVLCLEDGSQPREALDEMQGILVQTKADLPAVWHDEQAIRVSATTGEGLAELRAKLVEVLGAQAEHGEVWLTTERQADAVRRALQSVEAALVLPDELASYELEQALEALAEITGRDAKEDVVDAVFRQFCVGK